MSRRLKELEDHGVLNKIPTSKDKKSTEYKLTQSGAELLDVIISIGTWGKRWIDQKLNLENSDVGLLMWDIRRNIQMDMLPLKQATVEFSFSDIEKFIIPYNFRMIGINLSNNNLFSGLTFVADVYYFYKNFYKL